MLILSLRFQLWVLLLVCITGVQAGMRTITVDDADTSKIRYSEGWNIANQCVGCTAQLDNERVRNGTLHNGTESPDGLDQVFFTFNFTGTSVEAWYTAIDRIGSGTTNTNVSYSIDGIPRGEAQRRPTNKTDYLYNEELFRVDGLSNVEHVLRVDIQIPGVLLFDYLIYTQETVDVETTTSQVRLLPTSSPSATSPPTFSSGAKNVNIGAIVGGVLSGVLILFAASTAYYCLKHRRQRAQARLTPIPVVTEALPLHQPYTRLKLAGQAPYNPLHDAPAGANRPPFDRKIRPRSAVLPGVHSGTVSTIVGTSQGSSMSESVSHPPVPPRQGSDYPSDDPNQTILSSEGEPADRGLMSRHYSPGSLPPPYSPALT